MNVKQGSGFRDGLHTGFDHHALGITTWAYLHPKEGVLRKTVVTQARAYMRFQVEGKGFGFRDLELQFCRCSRSKVMVVGFRFSRL